MEISAQILAFVSLTFFVILSTRYFTHMFQLNSYTAKVQFTWYINNFSRLIPCILLLFAGIACSFFPYREYSYAHLLFAISSLILALCYMPKKAKKPLVYTARVKRLLFTFALLTIALYTLSAFIGKGNGIIILGFVALFIPVLIIIANVINAPIEAMVRNYYINDAKKMLRSHSRLKIIGITGSFGKTSVKYYLTALLSAKYNVLMTPESYNTPMGVVKTIRSSLRGTHEIFVCEMGAKYVGDIKELCDIVHPENGIVTSIGEQHLESFGSIQNIINTKYELASGIPEGGKLFINISSETVDKNRPSRDAVTYGLTPNADYYATDIAVSGAGTTFTLCHGDESETYRTRLIGEANVVNIVGAIAAANGAYGIALCDLKGAVANLRCVPHRMELIDRGGMIIIDDAFNSNPAGAAAALRTVGLFDAVKIIVTPGMIELGEKSDELNAALGKNAAAVCDYIVAVGERQAKPIVSGAKEAGFDENKIYVAKTFNDAMAFVNSINSGTKKKVVLLENDLPDNF
ncbi:MAG: UDP-N-acetylmuramoyl-tripeptide--D-alanyl-D-alanine ligase [Ruminococcaceae bacterium]|nr:UDP-N-acetylmuramoyl-tripeptide--D-alanyl-D-alanine ligase [Oscillospiraceae bacterium]